MVSFAHTRQDIANLHAASLFTVSIRRAICNWGWSGFYSGGPSWLDVMQSGMVRMVLIETINEHHRWSTYKVSQVSPPAPVVIILVVVPFIVNVSPVVRVGRRISVSGSPSWKLVASKKDMILARVSKIWHLTRSNEVPLPHLIEHIQCEQDCSDF